jgi:hypothetical protein
MGFLKSLAVVCASVGLAPVAMPAAPQPAKTPLTSTHADPAQPDISGLWVVTGAMQYSPDRSVPKLQGEYLALYEKRTQAFKAGIAVDDTTAECLPAGLPHLFIVPYPFEILQTPGRVTFLYEYDSAVRRVPLGVAVPSEVDPDSASYNGDSYGHWEGDTLSRIATRCGSPSTCAAKMRRRSKTGSPSPTRRLTPSRSPSPGSTGRGPSGKSRNTSVKRTTATSPTARVIPAAASPTRARRSKPCASPMGSPSG